MTIPIVELLTQPVQTSVLFHVVVPTHRLKMRRVDAGSVSALMMKLESFRDFSDHLAVVHPMGLVHAIVEVFRPIPVPIHPALPNPARRFVSPIFFDVFDCADYAAVADGEADVFALDPSPAMSSDPSTRNLSPAATLTDPRRIREIGIGDTKPGRFPRLIRRPLHAASANRLLPSRTSVWFVAVIERIAGKCFPATDANVGRLRGWHVDLLERSMCRRAGSVTALPGLFAFIAIVPNERAHAWPR